MSLPDFTENALLKTAFAGVTFTAPTTLYFALFTTVPAETGSGGVEVSGGSYARVAVTANGGMLVSGTSPTQVVNAAQITWPVATASWGTVIGAGIYDAASGGNMLHCGGVGISKTVTSGDTMTIASSQYKITLD